MRHPELLVPASSLEVLKIAVDLEQMLFISVEKALTSGKGKEFYK